MTSLFAFDQYYSLGFVLSILTGIVLGCLPYCRDGSLIHYLGYCRLPIRVLLSYEIIVLVLTLIAISFGNSLYSAVGLFVLTRYLCTLSLIDLHTYLLPDKITLSLLWLGLLGSLVVDFTTPEDAILGAAVGYVGLWGMYWAFKLMTNKIGVGYGDMKLLAAIGAWGGSTVIVPTLMVGSLFAIVMFGIITIWRRQSPNAFFAFGPFISLGGWAVILSRMI